MASVPVDGSNEVTIIVDQTLFASVPITGENRRYVSTGVLLWPVNYAARPKLYAVIDRRVTRIDAAHLPFPIRNGDLSENFTLRTDAKLLLPCHEKINILYTPDVTEALMPRCRVVGGEIVCGVNDVTLYNRLAMSLPFYAATVSCLSAFAKDPSIAKLKELSIPAGSGQGLQQSGSIIMRVGECVSSTLTMMQLPNVEYHVSYLNTPIRASADSLPRRILRSLGSEYIWQRELHVTLNDSATHIPAIWCSAHVEPPSRPPFDGYVYKANLTVECLSPLASPIVHVELAADGTFIPVNEQGQWLIARHYFAYMLDPSVSSDYGTQFAYEEVVETQECSIYLQASAFSSALPRANDATIHITFSPIRHDRGVWIGTMIYGASDPDDSFVQLVGFPIHVKSIGIGAAGTAEVDGTCKVCMWENTGYTDSGINVPGTRIVVGGTLQIQGVPGYAVQQYVKSSVTRDYTELYGGGPPTYTKETYEIVRRMLKTPAENVRRVAAPRIGSNEPTVLVELAISAELNTNDVTDPASYVPPPPYAAGPPPADATTQATFPLQTYMKHSDGLIVWPLRYPSEIHAYGIIEATQGTTGPRYGIDAMVTDISQPAADPWNWGYAGSSNPFPSGTNAGYASMSLYPPSEEYPINMLLVPRGKDIEISPEFNEFYFNKCRITDTANITIQSNTGSVSQTSISGTLTAASIPSLRAILGDPTASSILAAALPGWDTQNAVPVYKGIELRVATDVGGHMIGPTPPASLFVPQGVYGYQSSLTKLGGTTTQDAVITDVWQSPQLGDILMNNLAGPPAVLQVGYLWISPQIDITPPSGPTHFVPLQGNSFNNMTTQSAKLRPKKPIPLLSAPYIELTMRYSGPAAGFGNQVNLRARHYYLAESSSRDGYLSVYIEEDTQDCSQYAVSTAWPVPQEIVYQLRFTPKRPLSTVYIGTLFTLMPQAEVLYPFQVTVFAVKFGYQGNSDLDGPTRVMRWENVGAGGSIDVGGRMVLQAVCGPYLGNWTRNSLTTNYRDVTVEELKAASTYDIYSRKRPRTGVSQHSSCDMLSIYRPMAGNEFCGGKIPISVVEAFSSMPIDAKVYLMKWLLPEARREITQSVHGTTGGSVRHELEDDAADVSTGDIQKLQREITDQGTIMASLLSVFGEGRKRRSARQTRPKKKKLQKKRKQYKFTLPKKKKKRVSGTSLRRRVQASGYRRRR